MSRSKQDLFATEFHKINNEEFKTYLLTNFIHLINEKYKAVGVCLYFQKAFESLDHGMIFERLKSYLIIRGLALQWLT